MNARPDVRRTAALLARDARGAVTILTVAALTILFGSLALGVDVGMATLGKRRLQGVADQAALAAAASTPERRMEAIGRVLALNGVADARPTLIAGSYAPDPATPAERRFAPGSDDGAVRVSLSRDLPLVFGRVVTGRETVTVGATATAARVDHAALTLGSRLARVEGGLPGALLQALGGNSLRLNVMDQNALLGADVDLLSFSEALRTRMNLGAATFSRTLEGEVALPTLVSALADVAGAQAAPVLRRIASGLPGDAVPLSRLLDLGRIGASDTRSAPNSISVDAMSLLRESLLVANAGRQVRLDLGAAVPGLATTSVTLAVGERENHAWMTVARDGSTELRTAQTRLVVDAGVAVPGLLSLRLPLMLELASAKARLASISCHGGRRTVDVDAIGSPGTLAIAAIDRTSMEDMKRDPTRGAATLLDSPLAQITAHARTDLASDAGWRRVSFDDEAISRGERRRVDSSSVTRGIAASLLQRTDLRVRALGLGLSLTPLAQIVGAALSGVAPALDDLLVGLQDALGVHVGQAEVGVAGVRCGKPALVA